MRFAGIIIVLLGLTSCLKKDVEMLMPQVFNVVIERTPKYSNTFLNLNSKTVSLQTEDRNWQLKFQAEKGEWSVFLNPLIDISCLNTRTTDFESIDSNYVKQKGLLWLRDETFKGRIMPAIGTWGDYSYKRPKSYNNVYLLRINYGSEIRYIKFVLEGSANFNYTIRYADLYDDYDVNFIVDKGHEYCHRYLILDEFPVLYDIEPTKTKWDINFTYGLDRIDIDTSEMLINSYELQNESIGVFPRIISKSNDLQMCIENELMFEEIDYFYAKTLTFEHFQEFANPLIYFNKNEREYMPVPNVVLVLRSGTNYYKVKLEDIQSIDSISYRLTLQIQSM